MVTYVHLWSYLRILRRIKVSYKSHRENKTHSLVTFPFENRDIYEIIWKNIVEADRI